MNSYSVYNIAAVGLLVFNQDGQILVNRELLSDPEKSHKKANELSFPFETIKKGESPDRAVYRLISEEIGLDVDISDIRFFKGFEIIKGALTLMYTGKYESGDIKPAAAHEVAFNGWYSPEQLYNIQPIRKEVQPILREYFPGLF